VKEWGRVAQGKPAVTDGVEGIDHAGVASKTTEANEALARVIRNLLIIDQSDVLYILGAVIHGV
jgi:hypothetical protein